MARITASPLDTQDGAASVDTAVQAPAATPGVAADATQLTGGEWVVDPVTRAMTRVGGTEAPRHFSLKAPLTHADGTPAKD